MRAQLDDEADVAAAFQLQVWDLLAKQVALYTLGESTSLPEYDAHRLLASVCFVLGVDPDRPHVDREALRNVVDAGAEASFARGLRRIEEETRRVDERWREVCLAMPLLESVALKDTLESLKGFSARYEPRFFAHEIPADIDYPLSRPVPETTRGVDYVTAYLDRLLDECRFLRTFDLERCRTVLLAVHPAYGQLVVNLFEPVAANAVGCALAGLPVRDLAVGDEGRARIAERLAAAPSGCMRGLLEEAAETACAELGLCAPDDAGVREAVRFAAAGLVPRVRTALRFGSLEGVFAR